MSEKLISGLSDKRKQIRVEAQESTGTVLVMNEQILAAARYFWRAVGVAEPTELE